MHRLHRDITGPRRGEGSLEGPSTNNGDQFRNSLIVGVVVRYDEVRGLGMVESSAQETFLFAYTDGQTMGLFQGESAPRLTGTHIQPNPRHLKHPRPGDPIVFEGLDNGKVARWGYLQHFVDLVTRKHGTEFWPRHLPGSADAA